jgi:hypothetical protein
MYKKGGYLDPYPSIIPSFVPNKCFLRVGVLRWSERPKLSEPGKTKGIMMRVEGGRKNQ